MQPSAKTGGDRGGDVLKESISTSRQQLYQKLEWSDWENFLAILLPDGCQFKVDGARYREDCLFPS